MPSRSVEFSRNLGNYLRLDFLSRDSSTRAKGEGEASDSTGSRMPPSTSGITRGSMSVENTAFSTNTFLNRSTIPRVEGRRCCLPIWTRANDGCYTDIGQVGMKIWRSGGMGFFGCRSFFSEKFIRKRKGGDRNLEKRRTFRWIYKNSKGMEDGRKLRWVLFRKKSMTSLKLFKWKCVLYTCISIFLCYFYRFQNFFLDMEYYGNEEKMSETIIFLLITIKKKKKKL